MLPYAAYLRAYEPLSAFPEPARSQWAGYAASAARPRRVNALEAEQREAIRRVIAVPPIVAPERESEHAYVRQAAGVIYICPWQTRLRSWLALGRLRAALPPPLTDTFVPRRVAEVAAADFARWHARGPSMRTHILTATWHVPLAWFVPFGPPERWLVLGDGATSRVGPASAAQTRTLVYVTTMAQARRRVARALAAVRRGLSRGSYPYSRDMPPVDGPHRGHHHRADHGADRGTDHGADYGTGADYGPGGGSEGSAPPGATTHRAGFRPRGRGRHSGSERPAEASRRADSSRHAGPGRSAAPAGPASRSGPSAEAVGEIEEVGRWLEEFHPHALVELDYGGLVHLLDDESLQADQSVAEVAAAITGLETGELELAVAMYQRLRTRWRVLEAAESAS